MVGDGGEMLPSSAPATMLASRGGSRRRGPMHLVLRHLLLAVGVHGRALNASNGIGPPGRRACAYSSGGACMQLATSPTRVARRRSPRPPAFPIRQLVERGRAKSRADGDATTHVTRAPRRVFGPAN
jgi:hypothetical protein